MTLSARLARLEARHPAKTEGPRILIFNVVWRDDDGDLMQAARYAQVLTASGWQTIHRHSDEPESEFNLRAEAMAGDSAASQDWVLARLRRKHAPERSV